MKSDNGLGSFFLWPLKILLVISVFGLLIFFPLTWFSFIGLPSLLTGYNHTQVSFPNILLWFLSIALAGFYYWKFFRRWLLTGSFKPEYNDEYFKTLRQKWLKSNGKKRTKPVIWKINLSPYMKNRTLSKNYPVVNGISNLDADPKNYQLEINISHLFKGNVPINGDTLKISFKAKANTNIKALYMEAVDSTPESDYRNWGTVYSENDSQCICDIKKEIPFSVEKEIRITKDYKEQCSILIWVNLNETEQEPFIF